MEDNKNQKWLPLAIVIVILYLAGRALDDAGSWTIPFTSIQISHWVSIGCLTISCILFVIIICFSGGKWDLLASQVKFLVPWGMVIVLMIEHFRTFGCRYDNKDVLDSEINHDECILKVVILGLTNFIHSLACCDRKGDFKFFTLILKITMVGQIIYHGSLLERLVDELSINQKHHAVFYVALMIMWRVISIKQSSPLTTTDELIQPK